VTELPAFSSLQPSHLRKAAPALMLALAACVGVPAPHHAAPDRALPAAEASLPGSPGAQWPGDGWWRDFGDAELAALIEEGLAHAPDLATAAARVRRANAIAGQAGAALLPSLDANGQAMLDKRSYNNGLPKEFMPKGWNDSAQVSLGAAFDPDVWGRNRAALAAATSEARAAGIEQQQARLLLATGIASAWYDLARLHAERDMRAAALDVRNATRKLVAAKLGAGLETRGSLRQAEAGVATAQAALTAADEAIALRRNQLAALAGAGPDRGKALGRPATATARAPGLPEGVTTALIGRRADVAAARARIEAAASRIRVARADFFPAVRLQALIGLQALGIGNLVDADSTFGNVGPALSLPLFHGGALTGRYREAEARFDEAVAQYDGAVVEAYREVADAITAQDAVGRRLAEARAARAASEDAYRIARLRYEGGLSTFLDVLAVEDRLLDARLAVASLEAAQRSIDVALVRALGGGFDDSRQDAGQQSAAQAGAKDTPHG